MSALTKFAIVSGAPLMFGAVYLYNYNSGDTSILKTSFHQESVDLLKGYKKAIDVIGEPITVEKIDSSDPFNITDKNYAQIKLPITGKKRNADLFVFASKGDEDRTWSVNKLEVKYSGAVSRYKFYDKSLIGKRIAN